MATGKIIFYSALIGLVFISCEKSIDWEIESQMKSKLVVESILINEEIHQEIRLALSSKDLNQEPEAVDNAEVVVRTSNISYSFIVDQNVSGLYRSTEPFSPVPQLEYELEIVWNGNSYAASNQLSEVAPIPHISFKSFGSGDSLQLDQSVVPILSTNQQAMYQFDLDWSFIHPQGVNQVQAFYYTFTSLHNSEFIRPPSTDIVFPRGTEVILTKYGLNDDFADYLRSVAIETDWNGSYFFGNPENQLSNISGDAYGYFAICAVNRDSFIAE